MFKRKFVHEAFSHLAEADLTLSGSVLLVNLVTCSLNEGFLDIKFTRKSDKKEPFFVILARFWLGKSR